jgi:hypothetical protein
MRPRALQARLNKLKYEVSNPYSVSSAKIVLDRGYGHCLEAAMVAAYINGENYAHMILHIITQESNQKNIAHAVYTYLHKGNFVSVGRSKYSFLQARFNGFNDLTQLARSYTEEYVLKLNRKIVFAGYVTLDDLTNLDWKKSNDDLTKINDRLFTSRSVIKLNV